MKKLYLLSIVFIFNLIPVIHAQQQIFSRVIEKNGGDEIQISGMTFSHNNGYLIAGNTTAESGLLIEIDAEANVIWSKVYEKTNPGGNAIIHFSNILPTSDSNFFITGLTHHINYVNDLATFIKIDDLGDTLWAKILITNKTFSPINAYQTTDLGFVITGDFIDYQSAPYKTIGVCKLDQNGYPEWVREIAIGDRKSSGLTVKQLPDGSYIIAGTYENISTSGTQAFMMKMSPSAEVLWTQQYFFDGPYAYSTCNDFVVNDNGFLVNMFIKNYLMIAQTDFDGQLLWYKLYTNISVSGYESQVPRFVATQDGGFALTTGGEYWSSFMKINAVGDILWTNGVQLKAVNGCVTRNGEYLVYGNGPIYGVKDKKDDAQASIGLVQIDTLGNGMDCTDHAPTALVIDTVLSEQLIVTWDTVHSIISPLKLSSSSKALITREGCIDFVGSVSEMDAAKIQLFPNPSQGQFIVSTLNESEGELQIFNNLGCVVLRKTIEEKETTISLSGYPLGIYYYRYTVENKQPASGKLILTR